MFAHVGTLRESLRAIGGELWDGGKGWILVTVAAGWFLSIGVRYTYPSVIPFFRTDLGLDLTTAGFLLSGLWLAYALGQFPGGVLGDRIGEGNILVISTVISGIAVIGVAGASSVGVLFVATIAFGLATSLYGPTRFTIFTDIYDDRAGTAVGLSHAAGSIGNTILPAFVVAIATFLTWRVGYTILAPAFFLVTVGLWFLVPGRTSGTRQSTTLGIRRTAGRIVQSITRHGIPIVVAVQILLGFVSQGFLGFYPTYLVEVKGFSPQVAAIFFGAYFAVGILIQPLTGLSKDRFGSRLTLGFLAGAFFLGLLTLHLATSVVHLLLITVLLSHRNGTGVVTNTFVAGSLHDDVKGTGLGLLRTMWILIGATSPIIVGALGDIGLLTGAYLGLAVLAALATVLCLFVPDQ